ncbi:hypothetical protein QCA50_007352 [Cerrena zonata]|uniref:FAD-binding PCMH-type domain-containing protein n=1 Tax=Cerrena zonata TaxID=2478898 RepID=A0AAW0GKD5_9APHY
MQLWGWNLSLIALFSILVTDTKANTIAGISSEHWDALNTTVNGRLSVSIPFSKPCFSSFEGQPVQPDQSACSAIQKNYTDAVTRVNDFSAYMISQWETCQSTGEGCLLDSNKPTNPLAYQNVDCRRGNVATYYIEVQSSDDVRAAFEFSRRTGIRLSVKNHGHDYKGRSSGKDTLSLWLRSLDSISYNSVFVPSGCSSDTKYSAITYGGGALLQDVYEFADQHNVTFIGGYHQTIGSGWFLGGGHSILSPNFGLGVDRVVQIKVITPNGHLQVANECQNTDLFWALRGGGGSAFGVVMESTHRVEPQLALQAAIIKFPGNISNLADWYNLTIQNSLRWGQNGWGGHIAGPSIIHVTPRLGAQEAREDMQEAIDFAIAQGGSGVIDTLPSWNAFFAKYVLSAQAAVGPEVMLGTRLISTSLFETEIGRQTLAQTIKNTLPFASPYIVVGTPFLFNYTKGTTSVTPAWRNSLWHLSVKGQFNFNSTLEERKFQYSEVARHIQAFRDITPGSGAYFNEGDVYEPNHEESFWGSDNYARLLEVKRKYDPDNLLTCWQCVGWSGPEDPLYQCYIK